jgi:hypothetical protein
MCDKSAAATNDAAGAPEAKIEVTPEMIEAGVAVYCNVVESVSDGHTSVEEAVTAIFVAMAEIARSQAQ